MLKYTNKKMKIKKLFTAICLLFVALSFAQNSIDVMSYNIRLGSADDGENHWNIRKDKLKDLINYYEADFIGMQEAQKPQIEYLLENNSLYGFLGKPRDEGENSEFSCIFYLKNKYKVLQQDTFWLSETPEKSTKSWDAAYPRIVTYGLFENIKTKKKIWVLNTHFDHVGVVARQKSAEIILKKIKQLQDLSIEWHFIGHVQRNKTKHLAEHFAWVHGVDRLVIAERLSSQRPTSLAALNICLQVNIDAQDSKDGCVPADVAELVAKISQLPNLRLRGLMVIPAPNNLAAFGDAKVLFEQVRAQHAQPQDWDTLSMGMSGDLDAAIAAGSTMVRVGTALFGARDYSDQQP